MNTLPKAIPINMMQLQRLQGSLQLISSINPTMPSPGINSEESIKAALLNVKSMLKESGKQTILITNRGKILDDLPYFELTIKNSGFELIQANLSQKLKTEYSFETGTLLFGGRHSESRLDLEKFANYIKKIAIWMGEGKVDVTGEDHE